VYGKAAPPALGAQEADTAKEAVTAYEDEVAEVALPEREPVNPAVAVTEVRKALEPDPMTFFQFGI